MGKRVGIHRKIQYSGRQTGNTTRPVNSASGNARPSTRPVIEKVQKRATRLMVKDRSVCYEDRLRMLTLTTLETQRLRGDLIEVFKFLKDLIIQIY